jgi:hypothetical protein
MSQAYEQQARDSVKAFESLMFVSAWIQLRLCALCSCIKDTLRHGNRF